MGVGFSHLLFDVGKLVFSTMKFPSGKSLISCPSLCHTSSSQKQDTFHTITPSPFTLHTLTMINPTNTPPSSILSIALISTLACKNSRYSHTHSSHTHPPTLTLTHALLPHTFHTPFTHSLDAHSLHILHTLTPHTLTLHTLTPHTLTHAQEIS